jgi:hypothetical protein
VTGVAHRHRPHQPGAPRVRRSPRPVRTATPWRSLARQLILDRSRQGRHGRLHHDARPHDRSYYGLLRGLGGASVNEIVELPVGHGRSPRTAASRSSGTTGSRRTSTKGATAPHPGDLRRHPRRRLRAHGFAGLTARTPPASRSSTSVRRRLPTSTSGASSGTAAWPCSAKRASRWRTASRTKRRRLTAHG